MGTRPRTEHVMKLKSRRCRSAVGAINSQRTRCKRCCHNADAAEEDEEQLITAVGRTSVRLRRRHSPALTRLGGLKSALRPMAGPFSTGCYGLPTAMRCLIVEMYMMSLATTGVLYTESPMLFSARISFSGPSSNTATLPSSSPI